MTFNEGLVKIKHCGFCKKVINNNLCDGFEEIFGESCSCGFSNEKNLEKLPDSLYKKLTTKPLYIRMFKTFLQIKPIVKEKAYEIQIILFWKHDILGETI